MKKQLAIILTASILATSMVGCSKADENEGTKTPTTIEEQNEENTEKSSEGIETEQAPKVDKEYVLYLMDKNSLYLVPERYSIDAEDSRLEGKSLKEVALKHLIDFGGFESIISPVPEGTKLLGLTEDGDKIIVDFSKEYLENMTTNKDHIKVSLAAVVNTLTLFDDSKTVELRVEGENINEIKGIDVSEGLTFSDKFFMDK